MKANSHKGDLRMTTKATKWGNSVGVRIPHRIAQKYNVHDGTEIQIEADGENGIILKPIVEKDPTLEELLDRITDENRHEEYFKRPMGRELL
ncbi:AbrB/MazE/SpoVT family DNA-binding domain-containing protein [Bacillus sp. J14TS2]|uniref:AbrB/MazE/SpoVT family DNA-binding domain-containing protein n=1 Tax=Bacillus sp. J14TS2 TaxID=2807188 RepID=UPI001FD222CE|nr:AbrB/MazE/SpoVT family DNA-binding domain-containing protein [Bacillus sp. J14TS2]